MRDPFQRVDDYGEQFLEITTNALEARAVDPFIRPIIDQYLDDLNLQSEGLHLEIGSGSGPIARVMAAKANTGKVIGVDPSVGLTEKANQLKGNATNLSYEVGDGNKLRFENNSVKSVVMHTVLSHVPEPITMLKEAYRVLAPGGVLAICDADFEKSTLGNFDGDPLNACAEFFVKNFVTHPYLISDIRQLAVEAGFEIQRFSITARPITDSDGGLAWIRFATHLMMQKNQISEALAKSLEEEYLRRKNENLLYGFQPFGTLVAIKAPVA